MTEPRPPVNRRGAGWQRDGRLGQGITIRNKRVKVSVRGRKTARGCMGFTSWCRSSERKALAQSCSSEAYRLMWRWDTSLCTAVLLVATLSIAARADVPTPPASPSPMPTPTPECGSIPCEGTCAIGPVCIPGTPCPKYPTLLGTCQLVSGTCICVPGTPLPTPTTPPPPVCVGDCNGDGRVTISELMTGVNIALGSVLPHECPAFCNLGCGPGPGFRLPTVDCLVRAANNALHGCPAGCTTDQDCDDGNGCTIDHCTSSGCVHLCLCV